VQLEKCQSAGRRNDAVAVQARLQLTHKGWNSHLPAGIALAQETWKLRRPDSTARSDDKRPRREGASAAVLRVARSLCAICHVLLHCLFVSSARPLLQPSRYVNRFNDPLVKCVLLAQIYSSVHRSVSALERSARLEGWWCFERWS